MNSEALWWVIWIEDKKARKIRVVGGDDHIGHDDPNYGDAHIVPCIDLGETLDYGAHEFNRHCYCRPRIQLEPGKRPMVIHEIRPIN